MKNLYSFKELPASVSVAFLNRQVGTSACKILAHDRDRECMWGITPQMNL